MLEASADVSSISWSGANRQRPLPSLRSVYCQTLTGPCSSAPFDATCALSIELEQIIAHHCEHRWFALPLHMEEHHSVRLLGLADRNTRPDRDKSDPDHRRARRERNSFLSCRINISGPS